METDTAQWIMILLLSLVGAYQEWRIESLLTRLDR